MPKPADKGAKAPKAPKAGGYTVTIDGVSTTVKSGGDVKEAVLAALADGQAHSIEVDIVDVVAPAPVEPEV